MAFTILAKFGRREHLEALRSEGVAYMQSAGYFKRLEGDEARGDRYEGTSRILQPQHLGVFKLTMPDGQDIVFPPEDFAGPIEFGPRDEHDYNVFCLYALTRPTDLRPIDPKVQTFGDSVLLITNTAEFLRRFKVAAEAAGFSGEGRIVEYFDATGYSGETGPFRKSSRYEWQCEYRFLLRPGSAEPTKLLLGDLTDVTAPVKASADIASLLDLTSDKARAAGMTW